MRYANIIFPYWLKKKFESMGYSFELIPDAENEYWILDKEGNRSMAVCLLPLMKKRTIVRK
jgi:hypothetical protein